MGELRTQLGAWGDPQGAGHHGWNHGGAAHAWRVCFQKEVWFPDRAASPSSCVGSQEWRASGNLQLTGKPNEDTKCS